MSTPPFSSDFVAKLKQATAWRFYSKLGPRFTPRFFCCDDPNALGLSEGKEPVAVLELDPNPCLVGDTVTFDGTDSYDPDGSITAYAWTFPSGTPSTSTSGTSTVSWAAAGEYEVKLVVTDGTGLKSTPARQVQQVYDPQGEYYLAAENGVFYTSDGGQNWTAINTGLTGDALKVKDIKVDPATRHLPGAQRVLWIATEDGVYVSPQERLSGLRFWSQVNPASVPNSWSDGTAPTVANLIFRKLWWSGTTLFAIATWLNAGGDERSWLFYTTDTINIRSAVWFEDYSTTTNVIWSVA